MKKFVLLGAAGYIAPKHMKAIKEVGGDLVAVMDPHDSVGIIDQYFPNARYFSEFERFDRYCSMKGDIDYVSICSPTHLHDAHCRFALRIGAIAICEKPLVLNARNLDRLQEMEVQTGGRINVILQLRLSSASKRLKEWVNTHKTKGCWNGIDGAFLTYYTPRGSWYEYSWKSDIQKSGGTATNIGVHLFDIIHWAFGTHLRLRKVFHQKPNQISGIIDTNFVPIDFDLRTTVGLNKIRMLEFIEKKKDTPKESRTFIFEGFEDLHTLAYKEILTGRGFGIEEIREATKICEELRL